MGNESDIITVEIMGTRLQLRGGEDPEGVQHIAEYVRDMVEDLQKRVPTAPSIQIALLTAINIANELYEMNNREEAALEDALIKAKRILSKTNIPNQR